MPSKRPRSPLSLGSVLTLCLTALVAVGCVFVFGKIQGQNPEAKMSAERVIGLVGSALHGATPEPLPLDENVRTVTVTLAPKKTPDPIPPLSPADTDALPTARPGQRYAFSVTVGGMAGFHSDVSDSVYDPVTKTFDFSPIGAALKARIYADLNLATLPQVINAEDLKYADMLAPAAAAQAIRAMGFDQVLLSTEHALDLGLSGAEKTAAALTAQGLSVCGVNTEKSQQHRFVSVNGAKAAILAYTDSLTPKGQNESGADPTLLRLYSAETAREDIRAARDQGAGIVIVCMYWGKADTATPTNAQKSAARALAEMGADVILGSRPTQVLPVEILGCMREDGKYHETLVAYSLGSLLTESRKPYDISGMLLHFTVILDEYGMVSFQALEYTPTYIWRQSTDGGMFFRVVCAADDPPVGMSADQQQYMQNALKRVQKILENSPVSQRK